QPDPVKAAICRRVLLTVEYGGDPDSVVGNYDFHVSSCYSPTRDLEKTPTPTFLEAVFDCILNDGLNGKRRNGGRGHVGIQEELGLQSIAETSLLYRKVVGNQRRLFLGRDERPAACF